MMLIEYREYNAIDNKKHFVHRSDVKTEIFFISCQSYGVISVNLFTQDTREEKKNRLSHSTGVE